MAETTVSEISISRQVRQSIARFPEDATPAEKLLFRMSTLSTVSSLTNPKLKQFLLPLVRAL